MKRDYGEYSDETMIIKKFEEYEEKDDYGGYGYHYEDFIPWYLIFRAGFMAGWR